MEVEDVGGGAEQLQQIDAEEVHQQMREKEQKAERLPFSDTYLTYRHALVEWIAQTGDAILGLSAITVHLAVYYLDKAVSRQEVHPSRLQLVAVACLLASGTCFFSFSQYFPPPPKH